MAKKTKNSRAVDSIIRGRPFHEQERARFDDGGYVDYSTDYQPYEPEGPPTTIPYTGGVDLQTPTFDPSSVSTPSMPNIASDSGGGSSAAGAAGAGALGKLLGLSSGSPGLTALQALAGLGGAAASFSNNKVNTPTFAPPPLFGGAPGSGAPAAGQSNGGYGPPGGYNYKNYQGLTSATPGLGYAPRAPAAPNIPSYYTYGQGPQASFFTSTPQSLTPPTGAAPGMAPPAVSNGNQGLQPSSGPQMRTAAKGGLIRKYAVGGQVATPPPPGQLSPSLMGGPQPPPSAPISNPVSMPGTHTIMTPPMSGAPPQLSAPPQVQAPHPMPPPQMTGNMGMPQIRPGMQPPMMPPGRPPMPIMRPAPGVNQNPMMGINRPQRGTIMRASGGSTAPQEADMPSPGPVASSHTVGATGVSPLSQMFPQHRQWSGPQQQNPATPHAEGGALSSVSRHVTGPGDGTSDDIPARLATGEYVMDAQTVGMVGNGDNAAGAKKLDKFRAEIRKHKGKALAKGKMAPDAHKNLHKYMGGKS